MRENVKVFCTSREFPEPVEFFGERKYDFSKTLVLFIHGFTESYTNHSQNYIPPAMKSKLLEFVK